MSYERVPNSPFAAGWTWVYFHANSGQASLPANSLNSFDRRIYLQAVKLAKKLENGT